ncbi:MAG: hypothetical protein E4H14_01690 [Candidatus Thorarchaeota archaeon]|nr:MAG: hypothetical protein E4H14_01690 [Candidatus Thorarchaeota archaeon]
MTMNSKNRVDFVKQLIHSHQLFILVLIIAAIVWSYVFSLATTDFITGDTQPFRAVWSGFGQVDLFGFTVNFNFEGYLDYDYYYYSWGHQFLNGITPYTDTFNSIQIGEFVYNTPYFLPPLYVYMCALGVALPIDPFGIGFLISLFGFLTAIPIYGISTFLSQNPRVGAIAAATYLFNPLVLYHTVFEWLNPAPFVFFAMLSFFLLMRGNRLSGTLAMVTSALFKQTAFFLALPLLAYLLRKSPVDNPVPTAEGEKPDGDELDVRGFAKMAMYVIVFAVAISLPFLTDIGNYIYYIFQRPGGFLLDDVSVLPNVSQPISFAVLLISLNLVIQNINTTLGISLPEIPESIIQGVNLGTYYTVFFLLAMIPLLLLMLVQVKDDTKLRQYWSKMMFLTLILMMCLHLFSPRGIFKYYCVALIPFFSILPVSKMITQQSEKTKLSIFMILNPIIFGVILLFPSRYIYLAYLLLILVSYLLHKQFSIVLGLATNGLQGAFNNFRMKFGESSIDPVIQGDIEKILPNS